MKSLTYSEYFSQHILKATDTKRLIYDLTSFILGSLFLTLSSKISFNLPFTPVPVTLQTFAVLFLSVAFGKKAVYILSLYIFEGILGIPVFSKGAGLLYLLGPTGGYILGFLVASYFCGYLSELGFDKSFIKTFVMLIIGNLMIYFFGILWLLKFVNFNFYKAVYIGVLPFVVGDIIKILILTLVLPSGWKIIKK